jgi:hypothetical protein
MKKIHCPDCFAFSLVELMVAISITCLLLGMLCHFLMTAMQGWRQARSQADIFREIRPALTLLERDLRNMVSAGNSVGLAIVPAQGETEESHEKLYLLSYQSGSPQRIGRGDVALIGYWCEWRPEEKSFALMRGFQNSDHLFDDIKLGRHSMPPEGFDASPPEGWHSEKNRASVLIPCAWDFRVRPSDSSGSTSSPPSADLMALTAERYPRWIEIQFKTTDPESRKRMKAHITSASDWFLEGTPLHRQHILPQTRQFSARYPVGNGGS